MYEKPQYFTPDGFKRLSKNPYKDPELQRQLVVMAKRKAVLSADGKTLRKTPGVTISDEAAKLIAGVLKGMLNNREK